MLAHKALFTSPQRADPLSWILRFTMPLILAITSALVIVVVLLRAGPSITNPGIIIASGLCVVLACMLVFLESLPHRPLLGVRQSILPLLLSWTAALLSAAPTGEGGLPMRDWAGPLGIGSVIVALVPYSSAALLVVYGVAGSAVSAVLALLFFDHVDDTAFGSAVGAAALPLQAGIAGAVFSWYIAAGVLRWRALPFDDEQQPDASRRFEDRVREHGSPLVISKEIVRLLESVADGGRVSGRDRERALVLARSIRTDLVSVLNRSWLDTMAMERSLHVIDPGRMAATMTPAQRSAIHGLITTILDSPALAQETLRIELRGHDDGTTAVALSMDVTLPEGKRIMMLAPYFVTLRASVDRVHWSGGEQLSMRFQLPAAEQ
ncbi:hypothetical protein FB562_0359 [Homoserinimonas aerilata]|uniref:Uncharacterized protein n=1 Tax=Homoserinimonas aerilata TaxID=1162970 RepID=A0A542YGS3_9MICO|nr:hypothetical protein [Homoserinimonas aerilata]TQL47303.1 hypothetical protein FB562_0359 [Homoserinimonas aerilata]